MPTDIISENTTGTYTQTYVGANVIDTFIDSANPTVNSGSSGSLYLCGYGAAQELHTLIAFTGLSNISGPVTVSSATVGFYLISAGGDASVTVNAHRALRNWGVSTATWNTYDGTNSWTTAGAKGSGTDISSTLAASLAVTNTTAAWYGFTAAQLATECENWINGVNSNYGLLFHPSTAADAGRIVWSSQGDTNGLYPYLSVTYVAGANVTESIPLHTLTLTGVAPSVYQVGDVSESITASALSLTTFAPTVTNTSGDVVESITASSLSFTSFAPFVTNTGNQIYESVPSTGLTFTLYVPAYAIVPNNVYESVPVRYFTLTSYAPTVTQVWNVRENITSNALTLTSYAPTITVTGGNVILSIPRIDLRLFGKYPPAVRNTGTVEVVVGAGSSPRARAQRPKVIMVDGKNYAIESPWQEFYILQAYLDKLEKQQRMDLQKKKMPRVKQKIKLNTANITRTKTRIDKVKARIEWIKREDEEILAILAA